MSVLDPSASVASFVLSHPSAARTFERFGIDFCCRGRVALSEACRELAVPLDDVLADLARGRQDPAAEAPPTRDVSALIDYVVERHHTFARDELARLVPLARKVERAHGARHPELPEVRAVLEQIAADLIPHMRKEESVLFPLLRLATPERFGPLAPGRAIAVMEREHVELGRLLERLRVLSDGYVPPRDACTSYRVLYSGLEQLSADLRQHVHLENNALFPLALGASAAAPR